MSGMLQIPATLHDRAAGSFFEGTFDACLEAWIALPHEARDLATITVNGSIPDNAPTWFASMDAKDIARAVVMRENNEWP